METNAILEKILEELSGVNARLDRLEGGQKALEAGQRALEDSQKALEMEQKAMRKDIQTIKHDVKEMAFKVDTLYDWVDGIDLKVKDIDDRTA